MPSCHHAIKPSCQLASNSACQSLCPCHSYHRPPHPLPPAPPASPFPHPLSSVRTSVRPSLLFLTPSFPPLPSTPLCPFPVPAGKARAFHCPQRPCRPHSLHRPLARRQRAPQNGGPGEMIEKARHELGGNPRSMCFHDELCMSALGTFEMNELGYMQYCSICLHTADKNRGDKKGRLCQT